MIQLGATVNLVVCQKSKIEDWIEHFKTYYPLYYVYDLTNKNGFQWFNEIGEDVHKIGVINYELTFRRKELMQLHGFTLVCDESGLINNENAKRTKAIMNMDAENVILLSGTICGGKYEKLWSQMKLLGWKISKPMFYNHYVAYHYDDSNGFPLMIIDGYKNEERLKKKMRDYGCHFLKTDEVFDLPEQVHQTISIPTTSEYRKFRKDSIVIFDDPYDAENGYELVGDTTLTKMLYERQLCGQYNRDKLKAFQDLVESTNDRLIVFYNFNAELDAMQNVLLDIDFEEYSKRTSVVNGKLKALQNYENKSNSITFIQYQAGAMGLNLQKANKIIYFTPPLSSELFEQSKKRIHRIGQKSTCFYYYLTCKGSVEEKIYKTLAMRKDYTEALFEEGAADD
jgi:SNF2 family DNA or RNA helicase